jgi:hypothetical protein
MITPVLKVDSVFVESTDIILFPDFRFLLFTAGLPGSSTRRTFDAFPANSITNLSFFT